MNKTWIALVSVGLIAVIVIVGWDVLLTVTGSKSDFVFNILPIQTTLYGNLENNLLKDPNYYVYQQLANPAAPVTLDQTTSTDAGTTPATDTTTDTGTSDTGDGVTTP